MNRPATNPMAWKKATSPPRHITTMKRLNAGARRKTDLGIDWFVSLRAFYTQILSLLYSSFPFSNFCPRLAKNYLYAVPLFHSITCSDQGFWKSEITLQHLEKDEAATWMSQRQWNWIFRFTNWHFHTFSHSYFENVGKDGQMSCQVCVMCRELYGFVWSWAQLCVFRGKFSKVMYWIVLTCFDYKMDSWIQCVSCIPVVSCCEPGSRLGWQIS